MRRIDDGGEILDAHHAHVGDGGRAALVFLRLQLAVLGALAEILHLVGDGRQALQFGAADDRGDQAARDRHSDADIGVLVLDHVAVGPGDVGVRHVAQRQRHGLDDHVVDRELVGRLAILSSAPQR